MEGQRESFLLRTKQLSRLIGDDIRKKEVTGARSALGQRERRQRVGSAVREEEALSLGSVGTAFSRAVLRAGGSQPLIARTRHAQRAAVSPRIWLKTGSERPGVRSM